MTSSTRKVHNTPALEAPSAWALRAAPLTQPQFMEQHTTQQCSGFYSKTPKAPACGHRYHYLIQQLLPTRIHLTRGLPLPPLSHCSKPSSWLQTGYNSSRAGGAGARRGVTSAPSPAPRYLQSSSRLVTASSPTCSTDIDLTRYGQSILSLLQLFIERKALQRVDYFELCCQFEF